LPLTPSDDSSAAVALPVEVVELVLDVLDVELVVAVDELVDELVEDTEVMRFRTTFCRGV
jgi:hypothetical protein